jgi:hypothetical protein
VTDNCGIPVCERTHHCTVLITADLPTVWGLPWPINQPPYPPYRVDNAHMDAHSLENTLVDQHSIDQTKHIPHLSPPTSLHAIESASHIPAAQTTNGVSDQRSVMAILEGGPFGILRTGTGHRSAHGLTLSVNIFGESPIPFHLLYSCHGLLPLAVYLGYARARS